MQSVAPALSAAEPAAVYRPRLDPALPPYRPGGGVLASRINLAGDTATFYLAEQLAAAIRQHHPGFVVRPEDFQSTEAGAWWEDKDTLALLSEAMGAQEIAAFQRQWEYPPQRLRVAISAVAIVVHRGNPIVDKGVTLRELDAVFSATRLRGHSPVRYWRDLGIETENAEAIALEGLDVSSSLYVYFKSHVLLDGGFKSDVSRMPGSAKVVESVSEEQAAIGYVGLQALNNTVAVVPVSQTAEQAPVAPTQENVLQRHYPLAHWVYLYINRKPGTGLNDSKRELVDFIYSRSGQKVMAELGFIPLTAGIARQEKRQLR
jgi:phosphate transport system substrate-binding protein